MTGDDIVILDDNDITSSAHTPMWRVLVVDDDEEVHHVTRLALNRVVIEGRPLALFHAQSSAEALSILRQVDDIAVILLDVVMESSDAGLNLVRTLRDDMGRADTRLILRTGQAGYAPELNVIRDYDINDYREKSELTRTRLITSLTTAIRTYRQIETVRRSRNGLEHTIAALSDILATGTTEAYAEAVLSHLCSLLGVPMEGVLCVADEQDNPVVLAGVGDYQSWVGQPAGRWPDTDIRRTLTDSLKRQVHHRDAKGLILSLGQIEQGHALAVYLHAAKELSSLEQHLLRLFSLNVCLGFEKIRLVDRLRDRIRRDPLTSLSTRSFLLDEIDQRLRRGETTGMLCLLDLDEFSQLIDALDYPVGDKVLIETAERLREAVPDAWCLARERDVFAILMKGPPERADTLLDVVRNPYRYGDHVLVLRATLGYVPLAMAQSGIEALRYAAMALKAAKTNHRGRSLAYDPAVEQARYLRLTLLADLYQGLENDEFLLDYQPQLDHQGRLHGVEALVRWHSSKRGRVAPGDFIPLTESTGLIQILGQWVVRAGCRQWMAWRAAGIAPPRLSINASVLELRDPDYAGGVLTLLKEQGMPADRLEVEVTESVMAAHEDRVLENLTRLRDGGVRIAIDDFGTGYSSLSYLKRLPITGLKVDQSFVHGLPDDGDNASIVDMICGLASNLGLETIIEGVETAKQLDFLSRYPHTLLQGFHFSHPMPAEDWPAYRAGLPGDVKT